ncbi:hypothetical protein M885DRAFT_531234 [Pelagophyceae sp. CCMP2097]|nr:hypothetical protein M885DRAFT_531234 [Pelagophyceae sp. CCMP2097]
MTRATPAALDALAFAALQEGAFPDAKRAFRELLRRDASDAFAWMWAGRVDVALGDLRSAEAAFDAAIAAMPSTLHRGDANEERTLRARLAQLHLDAQRLRERRGDAAEAAGAAAETATARPRRKAITRVHHAALTSAAFRRFAAAAEPFVVTGLNFTRLTVEGLAAGCGGVAVPTRRFVRGSSEWAGMEDAETVPLDAWLSAGDAAGRVIFDVPISQSRCGVLREHGAAPAFAADASKSYGPSFFAAPPTNGPGSTGGLHVDDGGTHFWQAVHAGAKEYRVLDPAAWPRTFTDAGWRRAFFRDVRCSGLFGADAFAAAACDDGFGAPAVDAFDDAALDRLGLEFYATVVQAGEAIFVPANAPHQVRNARDAWTLAVSGNWVDSTNAHLSPPVVEYHPKWLTRLRLRGEVVPGSRAPWYARQRIVVGTDEPTPSSDARRPGGPRDSLSEP